LGLVTCERYNSRSEDGDVRLPLNGRKSGVAGNTLAAGRTVTSRVLALLGAFDTEHRQLTLTELAASADLSLPTAHRLAAELVAWGALERRESGAYVVGRRVWDLGLLAPVQSGLRQVAEPFLHDIYAATLATVHLAVREGLEVLYLDRLSGRRSVPIVSRAGTRLPAHATAVGKILLAHAADDVQEAAVKSLTRVTPYTITNPATFRRQLARARNEGYATTSEEMSLGACSVAVPIMKNGDAIAAVGLVVRSLKRDRGRLVASLRTAAEGISRSLAGG
jgi:DNA-binding IclR family transcriptional regulator